MFQFIIFLLLVSLLIANFNKGFIIIFVLSTWLSCFPLLGQNMMSLLSLVILILFSFKYGLKSFSKICKFPFKVSFLLISISLVLSNSFAQVKHTPSVILSIISDLFIVFVFWFLLNRNTNVTIKRFIKYSFIYAVLIGCYTLFETLTQSNPIVEFFNQINAYSVDGLIKEIRFGLKRSQSIFTMHTTNGIVSMLLFVLCYYSYRYGALKNKRTTLGVIFLLIFSVFSTGARSVILGVIISMLSIAYINRVKMKYILEIIISLVIVYFCFSTYLSEILYSFIDTDSVHGSNSDMRSTQFEIAFMYLNKSLWIGNGISYTWEFVLPMHKDLLGAESLWIPIMIDRGILGVLSYVLYFALLIHYCIKYKSPEFVFVVLGIFVTNSLSSLPNFSITYVSIYIYIMITLKNRKKRIFRIPSYRN